MYLIDRKKLLVIVDRTTTSDMLSHFCLDTSDSLSHHSMLLRNLNALQKTSRSSRYPILHRGGGGGAGRGKEIGRSNDLWHWL